MKLEQASIKKEAKDQEKIEEARKKQPRPVDRKDDYFERLAEFIGRKQQKKTKKERPANEKFI